MTYIMSCAKIQNGLGYNSYNKDGRYWNFPLPIIARLNATIMVIIAIPASKLRNEVSLTLIKWHCATLPTKHRFQTYLILNKTWLSKAYKDRSTLADTQCSCSFSLALNQRARKSSSPTRNFYDPPRFVHLVAYITHMILDPPLIVCVET